MNRNRVTYKGILFKNRIPKNAAYFKRYRKFHL